jgi:predicted O-methyltransferase YrrM
MSIINKFYRWGQLFSSGWGVVFLDESGEIKGHNTYNERRWKIEEVDGKSYLIFTGDSHETGWVEITDEDTMYGKNFEDRLVYLRRLGGKDFSINIKRAYDKSIQNEHLKWDGRKYFNGIQQQHPDEFADYLDFISDKNVTRYIEIGTFLGGSFISTMEHLSSIGRKPYGLACDVDIHENLCAYYNEFGNCELHKINSATPDFDNLIKDQQFDLAFIDGDHSYEGVKNDWEKIKDHSRVVGFHDIRYHPGPARLWKEIVATGLPTKEFIVGGTPLGIGVVTVRA